MKSMNSDITVGLLTLLGTLMGLLINFAITRLNTKNERESYVNKRRFDKEFEIYQELSDKNLTAVYDAGLTVPIVRGMYSNTPDKIINHIEKIGESMDEAEFLNKRYAPFIDKKLFSDYEVQELLHIKPTRTYAIMKSMREKGLVTQSGRGAEKRYYTVN